MKTKSIFNLLLATGLAAVGQLSAQQGCTKTAITANPGTNICAGQSITLTATANQNGTQFTWAHGSTSSSVIVTPMVSTVYTVVGKKGHCQDKRTISITVNPKPVISALGGSICAGQTFTIQPSGAYTYTISGGSAIVSPSVTTTYSVNGTSLAGCGSGSPAVLTVYVKPTPSVVAGPSQIVYYGYGPMQCAALGSTVTGVSAPYNYAWSNGATTSSISVCPSVTTVYTLDVTKDGCTGTGYAMVKVVDVRCGPANQKVLVCHNGNVICVAPAAVAAHLDHGCTLGACAINVGPGQYEQNNVKYDWTQQVNVYPNPNDGSFFIGIETEELSPGQYKIQVRNRLGEEVYSGFMQNENKEKKHIQLDRHLPAGIYYLHISEGEKAYVKKLMLEKY